jgi:hypothetical protein
MEGGKRAENNQRGQFIDQQYRENRVDDDPSKGIGFNGETGVLGGEGIPLDMTEKTYNSDPKEPFFVYDKEEPTDRTGVHHSQSGVSQGGDVNLYAPGGDNVMPAEMKHRPRLKRTPPENIERYRQYNDRQHQQKQNNEHHQMRGSDDLPVEKIQKVTIFP